MLNKRVLVLFILVLSLGFVASFDYTIPEGKINDPQSVSAEGFLGNFVKQTFDVAQPNFADYDFYAYDKNWGGDRVIADLKQAVSIRRGIVWLAPRVYILNLVGFTTLPYDVRGGINFFNFGYYDNSDYLSGMYAESKGADAGELESGNLYDVSCVGDGVSFDSQVVLDDDFKDVGGVQVDRDLGGYTDSYEFSFALQDGKLKTRISRSCDGWTHSPTDCLWYGRGVISNEWTIRDNSNFPIGLKPETVFPTSERDVCWANTGGTWKHFDSQATTIDYNIDAYDVCNKYEPAATCHGTGLAPVYRPSYLDGESCGETMIDVVSWPEMTCSFSLADAVVPECVTDDDCAEGETCVDGSCEVASTPCSTIEDCSSGFACIDDVCVHCTLTPWEYDLEQGFRCNPGREVWGTREIADFPECAEAFSGEGWVHYPCDKGLSCGCDLGTVCSDDVCVDKPTACSSDDDCANPIPYCSDEGVCVECLNDDNCGDENYCEMGTCVSTDCDGTYSVTDNWWVCAVDGINRFMKWIYSSTLDVCPEISFYDSQESCSGGCEDGECVVAPFVEIVSPEDGADFPVESVISFEQVSGGANDLTVTWDFGDGDSKTVENCLTGGNCNVTHKYDSGGTKTVVVRVSEVGGERYATDSIDVHIFESQKFNVFANIDSPKDGEVFINGSSVLFDASSSYVSWCDDDLESCEARLAENNKGEEADSSCYAVDDVLDEDISKYCFDLNKSNIGQTWDLLLNWTINPGSPDFVESVGGFWSLDYYDVVEFNKSFLFEGEYNTLLKMTYGKLDVPVIVAEAMGDE